MMNKKIIIVILSIFFFLTSMTSGCIEDFFQTNKNGVAYESHAVKVSYSISYGYNVNCIGTGEFNIKYDCDLPELLNKNGEINDITVFNMDYENVTLANNPMLRWDIKDRDTNSYKLGLKADITAESFVISDLSGKNALTISEIKENEKTIFDKYTNAQYIEDEAYIDPNHVVIKQIVNEIMDSASSENSFIVAKELFLWLKHNTKYTIHSDRGDVQPACITYNTGSGDCDDLSFLYISLLRAAGIPARFIRGFLVENNNNKATATAHAWVEVFVGGNIGNYGWIPVECACTSTDNDVQINQNFGVESAGHLRLFTDQGTNQSLNISISSIRAQYQNGINIDMTAIASIQNYEIIESKELHIEDDMRYYK